MTRSLDPHGTGCTDFPGPFQTDGMSAAATATRAATRQQPYKARRRASLLSELTRAAGFLHQQETLHGAHP